MCETNSTQQQITPPLQTKIVIVDGEKRLGANILRDLWNRVTNRTDVQRQSPRVDNRAMRRYLQHYDNQVTDLAEQLSSGRITTAEWERQMRREVSSLHITADAVGRGGLQNMTTEDLNRVNRQVEDQTQYLERWRRQMDDGDFPIDDPARIRQRGLTYGQNADVTLNRAALSIRGIPELPAEPKDGTTSCLYNCYCRWNVVTLDASKGDYNAFWVIDPSRENCPECIRRAGAWSPLEIRGGVVNQSQANRAGLYT